VSQPNTAGGETVQSRLGFPAKLLATVDSLQTMGTCPTRTGWCDRMQKRHNAANGLAGKSFHRSSYRLHPSAAS
jgi:hypothetical protein